MPNTFVFANFMVGELLEAITASATEISITPAATLKLELFTEANNKEARLVLWDGQHDPEIVGCVRNQQNGTLIITRAQESTSARAWEAGTQVRCAVTKAVIERAMEATLSLQEVLSQSFLPLAGGTLTGALTLSGAPTDDLHASTKAYVDSIQGNKLPLAGGTMSGAINMNNNRLLSLPAAVASTEPFRKNEADAAALAQSKINADRSGALLTTGTASAYTITTNTVYTALADGMTVRARVHAQNDDSATLSVDGLTAKPIHSIPGTLITPGLLIQYGVYDFVYTTAQDAWLVVGQFSEWRTGDLKPTLSTTASPGFLMMADQTIGDSTSGATYANDNARALFIMLWTNVSDTYAPVVSGRGASAAADWAAHKRITLTKVLGRALIVAGAGSGLTSRALGETLGAETHVLAEAEIPTHNHGGSTGSAGSHSHTYSYYTGTSSGAAGGGNLLTSLTSGSTSTAPDHTHTIANYGGGGAHNNMQPSSAINLMIHL